MVLDGCREAAGAAADLIHLAGYDVRYCGGCFHCLRTGACGQRDDVPRLVERLLKMDGVVVGSPVYEGQPTAQQDLPKGTRI